MLLYLALHSRRWASQWLLAQLWVYLSTVSTVCSANAGLDVRNLRIWQALAACGNGLCTGGCTCGPFPSDQTDLSQVPLPASNVGLGELAYDIFKYHMNSKLPLFRPTVKVLHRGASSFSAALVYKSASRAYSGRHVARITGCLYGVVAACGIGTRLSKIQ